MADHRAREADTETLAEITAVLAAHRVNYHHRNVGGDTSATLRYTSCEGCDWLGGWHDEAGWEAHVAEQLAPVVAARVAAARAEALEDAADAALTMYDPPVTECIEWSEWLRARAAKREAARDGEV